MCRLIKVGVPTDPRGAPVWFVAFLNHMRAADWIEWFLVAPIPVAHPTPTPWALKLWRVLDETLHSREREHFRLTPLPVLPRATIPVDLLLGWQDPDTSDEAAKAQAGNARVGYWWLRPGAPNSSAIEAWANYLGAASLTLSSWRGDEPKVLATATYTASDHSLLQDESSLVPGVRLIERELRRLDRDNYSGANLRAAAPVSPLPRRYSSTAVMGGAVAAITRFGKRLLRQRRSVEQWCLAFQFNDRAPSALLAEGPTASWTLIEPPADRFWADPCVVFEDGRWWVFFEELIFAKGKGTLAVLEIRRDGTWSDPRPVLELDCHLSYPFVFRYQGKLWMIPETLGNRRIELYRAEGFPERWVLHRTLIDDLAAVDATVFEHQGRWWMMANVVADSSVTTQDELHVFFTDDPIEGQWQTHPGNPVIIDATSARPAGRLWTEHGQLMRPSQSSRFHYGYGLRINRVETLDTHRFVEQAGAEMTAAEMLPEEKHNWCGLHTLNRDHGLVVVDVLRNINRRSH